MPTMRKQMSMLTWCYMRKEGEKRKRDLRKNVRVKEKKKHNANLRLH